jgi:hypothetical protein
MLEPGVSSEEDENLESPVITEKKGYFSVNSTDAKYVSST